MIVSIINEAIICRIEVKFLQLMCTSVYSHGISNANMDRVFPFQQANPLKFSPPSSQSSFLVIPI